MDDSLLVITGAHGQLGTALQEQYPHAEMLDSEALDITDQIAVKAHDWTKKSVIINAAAYTNVDGAESAEGRIAAWKANATGARNLAEVAAERGMTLVHISSDYVFDGTHDKHSEAEPFSPLNVYGQSKAAGDIAVSLAPNHYILRTTWVIGEGKNFVRTMLGLGQKGISPTVVADQIGRLTFTSELVRVIDHLLHTNPAFGTYNATNDGESASWATITREIYKLAGFKLSVADTTTAAYFAGKPGVAPRPLQSTMDLTKLQQTGFTSHDWRDDLKAYIQKESTT